MKKTPLYKYFFGISDVLVLFASFFIAVFILRRNTDLNVFEFAKDSIGILSLLLLLSILFIFIFQFNNLFRLNIILNRATHLTGIIKALYYGALNIVIISFLMKSSDLVDSRLIIFTFIIIALPLLYIVRVEILRALFVKLKNQRFKRNVLIVGDGKAGKLLATKLIFENPVGIEVMGFSDDDLEIDSEVVSGKKVLGRLNQLEELINEFNIDEILVAIDHDNYDRLLGILDQCKKLNVNVRISSELFNVVTKKMVTERYADVPVVDVSSHYNNWITWYSKRFIDITASFVGLILLSPLFFVLTLLIKISSAGPIFFKQSRIGRNGEAFQFYKFRSMKVVHGEDEQRKKMMIEFMKKAQNNNGDTKIINDSRVTWIGKFIRKMSLDELPQLINVLKGDMSLVGPRPCLPYEYENYDDWQKRRVSVIPGCTGVWQVLGRSEVSFRDSVVLDLYYINNMSPWLDLQLILQTIPTMLFLRGGK